jgi:hypothetical protein
MTSDSSVVTRWIKVGFIGLTSGLVLNGCGGGGPVEDIAQEISSAITCSLANCTDSSTMPISDIRTFFVITQQNGVVNVNASLGKTANVLTVVYLGGGDTISAVDGNQTITLQSQNSNPALANYAGTFNDASAQPTVMVNFNRGSTAYHSVVTMPTALLLQSPSSVNLGKAAGSMQVQLSTAANPINAVSTVVSSPMTGNCTRADSSTFAVQSQLPIFSTAAAPKGQTGTIYTISTQNLDAQLNTIGQQQSTSSPNLSPVTTCTLNVSWTSTVTGTSDPALYYGSIIQASRSVAQTINYYANM